MEQQYYGDQPVDPGTIIQFYLGYEQVGTSGKGMPTYREQLRIRKSVPPLTEVDYPATEADTQFYRDAYRLFEREQAGKKTLPEAGYPLTMWPVLDPHELQSCFAHGVYTVEQLARLTARGASIPAPMLELAKRAKAMVELQANHGQYEQKISELQAENTVLKEQAGELRTTIAAQRTIIDQMQLRLAAVYPTPQPPAEAA